MRMTIRVAGLTKEITILGFNVYDASIYIHIYRPALVQLLLVGVGKPSTSLTMNKLVATPDRWMPVRVEIVANPAGLKRQISAMSEMLKYERWHKVFLNQHPIDCEMTDLVAMSGITMAGAGFKKNEILGRAQLHEEQQAAFNSVHSLEDALALIEGYPGSGKTRLIGAMAAYLLSLKYHAALAAATHEATDNLGGAVVNYLLDTRYPVRSL